MQLLESVFKGVCVWKEEEGDERVGKVERVSRVSCLVCLKFGEGEGASWVERSNCWIRWSFCPVKFPSPPPSRSKP